MAVYPANPGVESLQALLLDVSLLLPTCIVQVVGVDDAHDMIKLICPALTVMVPVEVLGLLKHSYISLQSLWFSEDISLSHDLCVDLESAASRQAYI